MIWVLGAAVAAVPHTAGEHELSLSVDGRERALTVVVPERPQGAPVIVGLHWAGHGGMPHFATGYVDALLRPAAPADAVLIAPDCPSSSWTTPASEEVVLALVDRVVAELGADPRRVVLTGYSMGGEGAWWLASRHPERFVAVVPMAARPSGDVAIPLRAIHGERDELRPVDGVRTAVDALVAAGRDARLQVLPGLTHFETTATAPALRDTLRTLLP